LICLKTTSGLEPISGDLAGMAVVVPNRRFLASFLSQFTKQTGYALNFLPRQG